MTYRINVDNRNLPGIASERETVQGSETHRECVYRGSEYLGDVVYCARKGASGTLYGWRPAKAAAQSKLTTKVDAIRRLPRF